MRVVYYTHTAFFEVALSIVRALARRAEVHLLLEVAPAAWRHAAFDLDARWLDAEIVPADGVLADHFPPEVRACWSAAASFHLVAHRSERSLHPDAWRLSRRVLDFAHGLRADALHVDDVDVSPRLALALAHAATPPLVLSVHDPQPHTGERDWRKRLARLLAYSRAARFVLHNEALHAAFCARHRLRPDAVAIARFGRLDLFRAWGTGNAAPPSSPPTVLFFGRLSPYKGLDVLYRAMPRVAERVPGVRFVVAGRPVAGYAPPPPPTLPPPSRVEVHARYLPNAELAARLEDATVVACPYRDATQSGVLLAALAFGRPVVASAVGGIPEYIEHGRTGLLVPPGDADALADALARVLENGELRQRLVHGIEETAGEPGHGWERMADALLDVYAAAGGARLRA